MKEVVGLSVDVGFDELESLGELLSVIQISIQAYHQFQPFCCLEAYMLVNFGAKAQEFFPWGQLVRLEIHGEGIVAHLTVLQLGLFG